MDSPQTETKPEKLTKDVPNENVAKEPGETKKEEKKILPTMRKIIIETDGNIAKLSLAEVAGKFELISILQTIINLVQQADIKPNMK